MIDHRGKGQCDRCGSWEHERHLSYSDQALCLRCADAVEEERERMTEDDLIRVWSAFCAIEGIACYSADEVILRDDLTDRQRSFVSTFIALWSHAV